MFFSFLCVDEFPKLLFLKDYQLAAINMIIKFVVSKFEMNEEVEEDTECKDCNDMEFSFDEFKQGIIVVSGCGTGKTVMMLYSSCFLIHNPRFSISHCIVVGPHASLTEVRRQTGVFRILSTYDLLECIRTDVSTYKKIENKYIR